MMPRALDNEFNKPRGNQAREARDGYRLHPASLPQRTSDTPPLSITHTSPGLLDGGTTEDGLPYFLMEFIEGQPLYSYCDNNN
jgi:hypothetical protein